MNEAGQTASDPFKDVAATPAQSELSTDNPSQSEMPIPAIPAALQPTSPLTAPYGLKKDGTPKKKHTGGRNGGIAKGTELSTKLTYDPELLAQDMAITLSKNRGVLRAPTQTQLSNDDRKLLARAIGEPVEAFNDRLATKLRSIADKLADSIEDDVDNNRFKPGEKGFIFSVVHDKRLSLDGSRALNNASVNIQVNNFGSSPKDQLLTELDGMTNVTPITSNPDLVAMDSSARREKTS